MSKIVSNMQSSSGRPVANQFIIHEDNREIFQSYDTIIAIKEGGKVYLDRKKWDFSKTTLKYLRQFLDGNGVDDTRRKIKDGIYILKDLN